MSDEGINSATVTEDVESTARVELLIRKVAPIARVAASTRNVIKLVAISFTISGIVCWYVLFIPLSTLSLSLVSFSIVVALLFLIPPMVWGLFFLAVGQVTALPSRLGKIAEGGREHLSSAVSSTIDREKKGIARRVVGLLRSLVDASGTFAEAKVLLIESTALLRVFNPITLAVVGVTFILGIGLIVCAIVGLVLSVLV